MSSPAQNAAAAPTADDAELAPAEEPITSVSLNATNPVCGTHVTCPSESTPDYDPAPPISAPSGANYSVGAAWWVEGDGPNPTHLYPRTTDIDVDGSKYYKFVIIVVADEGYVFDEPVPVTVSKGSVIYTSSQMNQALLVVVEIPATHDEVTETSNVVEPTCTKAGSHTETVTCKACGTVISEKDVTDPALGHEWSEWTVSKNPTATEPGELVRVCKHDSTHVETRPIPPIGETKASMTPKTGDETNLALPGVLVAASAAAIGGYFFLRRKTEQE